MNLQSYTDGPRWRVQRGLTQGVRRVRCLTACPRACSLVTHDAPRSASLPVLCHWWTGMDIECRTPCGTVKAQELHNLFHRFQRIVERRRCNHDPLDMRFDGTW